MGDWPPLWGQGRLPSGRDTERGVDTNRMKWDRMCDGAISESGQEALEQRKAQPSWAILLAAISRAAVIRWITESTGKCQRELQNLLFIQVFSLAYLCEQHHIINNPWGQARKYCPNFSRVTEVYSLCVVQVIYLNMCGTLSIGMPLFGTLTSL